MTSSDWLSMIQSKSVGVLVFGNEDTCENPVDNIISWNIAVVDVGVCGHIWVVNWLFSGVCCMAPDCENDASPKVVELEEPLTSTSQPLQISLELFTSDPASKLGHNPDAETGRLKFSKKEFDGIRLGAIENAGDCCTTGAWFKLDTSAGVLHSDEITSLCHSLLQNCR